MARIKKGDELIEELEGWEFWLEADQDSGDPREEWDNWSEEDVECWKSGDVYGAIVYRPDGGIGDSCWGFYGHGFAIELGKEMLRFARELEKAESEKSRRMMRL